MLFDIVCILIIIAGGYYGYRRGAISQLGSITGVLLGIVCCNIFATRLAEIFIEDGDSLDSILLCYVLSYIIIFVICYILGRIVGSSLSQLAHSLHLTPVDRICGRVFALVEFTLIFSLVLNIYIGAFPRAKLKTEHSGVKNVVLNFAPVVLGSPTVNDIFNSMQTFVEKTGNETKTDQAHKQS